MKRAILSSCIYILILIVATTAHAKWIQYDNFDSGYIDGDKWVIQQLSALISVENEKVKFQHYLTMPNISSYLIPKIDIEKIRGIKFTVIFDSCNSVSPGARDARARVTSNIGFDEDDYLVWSSFSLQPYFHNENDAEFVGELDLLDISQGYALVRQLFWGHFLYGMLAEDVMGIPYVFTMEWTKKLVKFRVEGQGEIEYSWDKTYRVYEILDPAKAFVGIGTRSYTSGSGNCTFYFDDVYLKYKE